jgi:ubiquinone/menaquinone biosynthesis C-methylase UbiE
MQALKNTKGLSNAYPTRGNFQSLPFSDNTFDLVYAIEGLCHATNMPLALSEVYRVTKPNGRFVVIDGWRSSSFEDLSPTIKYAAKLVEESMAVGMPSRLDVWKDQARESGWSLKEQEHTSSIMPNLERFARLAEQYLDHPRLARLSQRLLPKRLLMNAVAAYLMPLCVQARAYTYSEVTLIKPATEMES